MSPSAVESCPRRRTFGDRETREASSRLPLGEERANILLVACCYQEGSAAGCFEFQFLQKFALLFRHRSLPILLTVKVTWALQRTKLAECADVMNLTSLNRMPLHFIAWPGSRTHARPSIVQLRAYRRLRGTRYSPTTPRPPPAFCLSLGP